MLFDAFMLLCSFCRILSQYRIILSAKKFLKGQNRTTKENVVFLAMLINLQGNIYSLRVEVPWRVLSTCNKITHFLEC
jgi:hypothetical protein